MTKKEKEAFLKGLKEGSKINGCIKINGVCIVVSPEDSIEFTDLVGTNFHKFQWLNFMSFWGFLERNRRDM